VADGNPRRVRIERAIRTNLTEMLEREVKDPRVHAAGLVTIQLVELNRDLSVARVYVSFSLEQAVDQAMAGLRAAAGYLRGPLGRRLRLARPPELRFVHDTSPEFAARLSDIVREDRERAQAAGRGDDDE
jgi:ribosome-binding factor A